MKKILFSLALAMSGGLMVMAETVGAASYLTEFPGTDNAGRNAYPPGAPAVCGAAADRPVPTNDWWSNELINSHGAGIFNYPMALKPLDAGLAIIRNMEQQAITAENPLVVGLEGLDAPQTAVSDYSDWTVTLRWPGAASSMEAVMGQGMPMVYFTRTGSAPVRIAVAQGAVSAISDNIVLISKSYNGASYAAYAPSGAKWKIEGNVITSDLAGKDYWTVAMLPEAGDDEASARSWSSHAFVFPADTKAEWSYEPSSGLVRCKYSVTPCYKEGSDDEKPIIGLLPHHWANLAADCDGALPAQGRFSTVRGELRLVTASEFTTERTFSGILPVLPAAHLAATGYSFERLKTLVDEVCDNTGFDPWTDSYNDGQLMNRLSQTAMLAREAGYDDGADRAVSLLKTQLEKWFTAASGDVAFVFYYHKPWNAMLAYPAGHGQDSNLNDHNFHFGYFIEAAATVASFDPEWASKWGAMVDLLVRDIASIDRNDPMFPYLRSFSPYSGHCWANGFATLGPGNDQESTSEAMMCHAAMIKWAEVTGNTALRDAAVWMFATELSAIQEYWFDTEARNRPSGFASALASRVFANGYDDENFWGGGIAGSYDIQIYPVQPSSTYLVDKPEYASRLWESMCARTGILGGDTNPNIWYDAWAQFRALSDPAEALDFYNRNISRMGVKFGASHALTYYWIHALAAVGTPDLTLTADKPLAQAFRNGDVTTYVAANYSASLAKVTFSDGTTLDVAPRSAATFVSDGTLSPVEPSDPSDPSDPDKPGTPSTGECIEISSEASEGEFKAPYTIGFTTLGDGGGVKISASFGDESAYTGFAGPWLFNETDGFAEIPMNADPEGGYSATLNGVADGTTMKVRVKIAFAGGLAVTRQLTYVAGTDCSTSGVEPVLPVVAVDATLSGSCLMVRSAETGYATLFAADGRRVGGCSVEGGYTAAISVGILPSDVYILRVEPGCTLMAPSTIRIIKK